MRTFIWILVFTAMAISAHAADQINDMLIVPDERVGPITEYTAEEEIKELLPAAQMKRAMFFVPPDGGETCATIIDEGTDKELIIVWDDEQPYKEYEKIRRAPGSFEEKKPIWQKTCDSLPPFKNISIIYPGPAWSTAEGIHLGSSLFDLEKANGKPVKFVSFCECCGDGAVEDWNGGKYDDKANKNLNYNAMGVTLQYMHDKESKSLWDEDTKKGAYLKGLPPSAISDEKKKRIYIDSLELSFPTKAYVDIAEFQTTLEGYELTCQEKVNVFTKENEQWRQVLRDLPHKGIYFRDDEFVGYGMCDYVVCQPLAKPYTVSLVEYREVGKKPIPSEKAESYTVKDVTAYESAPLKGEIKINIDYFSDDKCENPKQFSTIINQP